MSRLSVNSRYKILCKLYKKYKSSMRVIKPNEFSLCEIRIKADDLNKIMQEIEKFPIPWSFYTKQKFRFSYDFETLVIFNEDI